VGRRVRVFGFVRRHREATRTEKRVTGLTGGRATPSAKRREGKMARQITTRTTAPFRPQCPRGLRLVLTRALARERHAELAPLADDVRVDRKAGRFLNEHDLFRKPASTFRDHALVLMFRSLRDVLRVHTRERTDAVA